MTAVELIKYIFDYAMSGFWNFLSVYVLLHSIRLFSYSRVGGGK